MPYKLSLFLHIYQPPTQFPDVIRRITRSSYLKIVELLQKNPRAKITLNLNGSLTEQLREGYRIQDTGYREQKKQIGRTNLGKALLKNIRELTLKGQVEFTGSAAYHPLLPKLPREEIVRQIKLNDEINCGVFGDTWHPNGFFPPEMAWSRKVGDVLEKLGFEWVILDETALPWVRNRLNLFLPYRLKDSKLKIFFRQRELSLRVAFAKRMNLEEFLRLYKKYSPPPASDLQPPILAMDGETFGHHHPGQLKLLEELFASEEFELLKISELQQKQVELIKVEPRDSAWGVKERWDNPRNPIHRLQWELFYLAIDVVKNSKHETRSLSRLVSQGKASGSEQILNVKTQMPKVLNLEPLKSCLASVLPQANGGQVSGILPRDTARSDLSEVEWSDSEFRISDCREQRLSEDQRKWLSARLLLDRAVHSDQFWWASHNPCWHPKMIGRGARMLKEVVLKTEGTLEENKEQAKGLYDKILKTGKELYGEKVIGC